MKDDSIMKAYEQAFGEVFDGVSAFSFWKGRVALCAILRALEIKEGDEVIVPGFTCVAVPNAIKYTGATPVYADIDRLTYNIDYGEVVRKLSPRTRVLIVQHTFGIPADMERLLHLAKSRDVFVVEDCAHCFASTYLGRPLGTFGDAAFFSSQWSKPYSTGLGGMAITRRPDLSKALADLQGKFATSDKAAVRRLRLQYSLFKYFFSPRIYWSAMRLLEVLSLVGLFVGSSSSAELDGHRPDDYEWRMSGFQAEVGMGHLRTVQSNMEHRRQLADYYAGRLRQAGRPLPETPADSDTVFLRYPVRVKNKAGVLSEARKAKIEVGSWFETVIHPVQPSFEAFAYRSGSCPEGERAAREIVNLPLHPRVKMSDAKKIADLVLNN